LLGSAQSGGRYSSLSSRLGLLVPPVLLLGLPPPGLLPAGLLPLLRGV
jgi:hypothetical protein